MGTGVNGSDSLSRSSSRSLSNRFFVPIVVPILIEVRSYSFVCRLRQRGRLVARRPPSQIPACGTTAGRLKRDPGLVQVTAFASGGGVRGKYETAGAGVTGAGVSQQISTTALPQIVIKPSFGNRGRIEYENVVYPAVAGRVGWEPARADQIFTDDEDLD